MKKYFTSMTVSVSVAISLIGGHALAAWTQSNDRYVEIVSAEATDSVNGPPSLYIGFSSTPFTSSCSNGNTLWKVGGDADSVKAIQSVAIAAKLSRVRVQAVFNNSYSSTWSCSGGGTTGYPMLRGLSFRPAS